MLDQISTYFSAEIVYLWLNIGVIPFWLMLIFLPNSKLGNIFISSVFPIFILSLAYIFMIYKSYLGSYDFFENFNLYLGINNLSDLFSNQEFLIPFWIHFLAINLFCGSWIVRDYQKINMPKFLAFFPLIVTYFIGPFGLSIYWLFRIFYSKRIDLYE